MSVVPFFRLPFSVNAPNAPKLPAGSAAPLFPLGPEQDARAHWLFGGSDASLADLIGGRLLTPAGAAPTFAAGHVQTSDGLNGLKTPFADVAVQTQFGVFRKKALVSFLARILFASTSHVASSGGMIGYSITGSGGSGNSGGVQARVRPGSNVNVGVGAAGINDGEWFFFAISETAGAQAFYLRTPTGLTKVAGAITKTPAIAGQTLALGAAYYGAADYQQGVECAEYAVYDRALTDAEIAAVYSRSKVRLAERGIALI